MNPKYRRRFVFLLLATSPLQAEIVTHTFDGNDVKRLEFKGGSGKLSIAATESGKATIATHSIKTDQDCEVVIHRSGPTLQVRTKSKSWFFGGDCEVNFDIEVPRSSDLEISLGSGSARIKGSYGSLDYKLGSGAINFEGDAPRVEGKAGSGSTHLQGNFQELDLKTGSGKIELRYLQPPAGSLSIRTGSGNTAIFLPSQTKVKTTFKSGSGRMNSDFSDADAPTLSIDYKAGSGNLSLKKEP